MKEGGNFIGALKDNFSKIKKITREISSLSENIGTSNKDENRFISSQISSLKVSLREANDKTLEILNKIYLAKPLNSNAQKTPLKKDLKKEVSHKHKSSSKILRLLRKKIPELERKTIKRLRKKGKETKEEKVKEASKYVWIANKVFSNFSMSIVDNRIFRNLKRDLIKANLQFIPSNYISVILFTTLLSLIGGFFTFLFFLFFNISPMLPIIIPVNENLLGRFLKVFWVLFAIPIGTFLMMYFYPWLEKKSIENIIDQELPFATIHMSAIAGSMIDPSKIFSIIISTKEYPELEKKFTKLINEVHVYGYDLASAIRNMAFFSPSTKLSELFNGIATTITSGGDLADFFDKRARSLLFEHRIEREKQIRAAETFMDIYISVVIAAPMILMLLLIMMKVSGLGVSFSTGMITVIIVSTVSVVNVLFLSFLHMKQPKV